MDILPTSTTAMTGPASSASPGLPPGADTDDPFLAVLANLLLPGLVVIPADNSPAATSAPVDGQPVVGTLVPGNFPQQSVDAGTDGPGPVSPKTAISPLPVPSAAVEPEAPPTGAAIAPRSDSPAMESAPPTSRVVRKAASGAMFIRSDLHRPGSPMLARQVESASGPRDGLRQAIEGAAADGGPLVQSSNSAHADGGSVDLVPPPGAVSVDRTAANADTISPVSSDRSGEVRSVPLGLADQQGRSVTARLFATDAGDGQRLRIQLDPADLGRVEVALRLDHAGTAAALFTVDRPETLLLLQRDTRAIADMLSSAGYTLDPASVGFTLRDGNGGEARSHQPPPAAPGPRGGQDDHGTVEAPSPVWSRHGLLDLHV